MDNREILKNLLISEIKKLDKVILSKAYTYVLQLSPSKKDFNNISKEDLMAEFLNKKLNISDNTAKNYKSVLLGFLNYSHPNIDKDILIAYLKKAKDRWSRNTRRRNYIFIKNFLKHLHKHGYLDEDLTDIITVPKKVRVAMYIPDDDEINLFFTTLKKIYKNDDDRLRYITIFSIYVKTGIRLCELINLNYKDIDIRHSRIYLNQTKNGDKDYLSTDSQLEQILSNYIDKFNISEGALIIGKAGRRIHKNVLTNNLKRIIKEANLPEDFRMHSLRRYFIDKQSRSNPNVFLLSELARHKDVNTTRGYLNVREEDKRAAISNIKIAV